MYARQYAYQQADIGQEAVFKHAFDQINSDERKSYLRTPSIKAIQLSLLINLENGDGKIILRESCGIKDTDSILEISI